MHSDILCLFLACQLNSTVPTFKAQFMGDLT
uniref:Uncharacterized protein n=1 Tax=Anguilla anguilla TaxID=7936 RepID=A0A0E9P5J1_ANGAN